MAGDLWREDERPREGPTAGFVAIHATDEICTDDIYTLVIRHVIRFPDAKGFMPSVRSSGGLKGNGGVHRGTGQAAYDAAVKEGREYLARCVENLQYDISRYAALEKK